MRHEQNWERKIREQRLVFYAAATSVSPATSTLAPVTAPVITAPVYTGGITMGTAPVQVSVPSTATVATTPQTGYIPKVSTGGGGGGGGGPMGSQDAPSDQSQSASTGTAGIGWSLKKKIGWGIGFALLITGIVLVIKK